MTRLKLFYIRQKETFLHWFWSKVPDSWFYWAVIYAWSRVTTKEFINHAPDEVTWSMTVKALEKRGKKNE